MLQPAIAKIPIGTRKGQSIISTYPIEIVYRCFESPRGSLSPNAGDRFNFVYRALRALTYRARRRTIATQAFRP
jgi:hypothetical protein